MDTALKAKLESKISDFLDENCEADDYPDMFAYRGLVRDMATAAAMVFDACYKGQSHAKRERV